MGKAQRAHQQKLPVNTQSMGTRRFAHPTKLSRAIYVNILARYRKLNFWNKLFVWSAFITIIGFALQLLSTKSEPNPLQSIVNSPGSVQIGGSIIINHAEKHLSKPKVNPPFVQFSTIDGLPAEFQGGTWSQVDTQNLRWNKLSIINRNKSDLLDFDARIQLPEPIKMCVPANRPAGVEVLCEEIWPEIAATGASTRVGMRGLTGVWRVKISRLPANKDIEISFFTTNSPEAENYLATQESRENFHQQNNEKIIRYHLKGNFSHMSDNGSINREIYVIIDNDRYARTITSRPVQETKGDFKFRKIDFFN